MYRVKELWFMYTSVSIAVEDLPKMGAPNMVARAPPRMNHGPQVPAMLVRRSSVQRTEHFEFLLGGLSC